MIKRIGLILLLLAVVFAAATTIAFAATVSQGTMVAAASGSIGGFSALASSETQPYDYGVTYSAHDGECHGGTSAATSNDAPAY